MAQNAVYQPIYTGNNVQISINGKPVGLFETLTISRSVGRTPRQAIGSPLFVDAPVGAANVTVTGTNMIPVTAANSLPAAGVNPSGSLIAELQPGAGKYHIDVISSTGVHLYTVINAFYNSDSAQINNTDIITGNLSWIAQDTVAWT